MGAGGEITAYFLLAYFLLGGVVCSIAGMFLL